MTQNRSSEELDMRRHLIEWGRKRWPDARVVHELVVGECRIDLAFIRPNDLIGIEIKSSKDTLSRLDKQMRVFTKYIPQVWLAIAPKWEADMKEFRPLTITVKADYGVVRDVYGGLSYRKSNPLVVTSMLHLIWKDEAKAIASRKRVSHNSRSTLSDLVADLAQLLTGAEVVAEVCRELRGRHAFAAGSDDPIIEGHVSAPPIPAML